MSGLPVDYLGRCIHCGVQLGTSAICQCRQVQSATTAPTPAAPAQGETPRTDALRETLPFEDRYEVSRRLTDHARTLERELAEAKAEKMAAYMCYEGAKADIASLRAQVARLTSERDEARDCGQRVDDKLAAAESELAALRQDRERLNWLGANCTRIANSERYLPTTVYWGKGTNKDIRAAIDAAMQSQEKAP